MTMAEMKRHTRVDFMATDEDKAVFLEDDAVDLDSETEDDILDSEGVEVDETRKGSFRNRIVMLSRATRF
jgi:hypothetical protein